MNGVRIFRGGKMMKAKRFYRFSIIQFVLSILLFFSLLTNECPSQCWVYQTWGDQAIDDLSFSDSLHGFLVLHASTPYNQFKNTIMSTNDGGRSWRKTNSYTDYLPVARIIPLDSTICFFIIKWGSTCITFRSNDAGMSWQRTITTGWTSAQCISFFPASHIGLLTDGNGLLWRSTDGGQTWSQTIFPRNHPTNIECIDSVSAVVIDASGAIFRTVDRGQTWDWVKDIKSGLQWWIASYDGNNWLVKPIYPQQSYMLKTPDGGLTWDSLWTPLSSEIVFLDSMTIVTNVNYSVYSFSNQEQKWHSIGSQVNLGRIASNKYGRGFCPTTRFVNWAPGYECGLIMALPEFNTYQTTLFAPANHTADLTLENNTTQSQIVRFRWSHPKYINLISGRLQLAQDSMFTQMLVDTVMPAGWNSLSETYRISHIPLKSFIYWRLTLELTDSIQSEWSPIQTFNTAGGVVRGQVYLDQNKNQLRDAGEECVAQRSVSISGSTSGEVLTDSMGNYSFEGLGEGSYTIGSFYDVHWRTASPMDQHAIHLQQNDTVDNINFGWFYATNSFSGKVFHDLNENGLQDVGEPGVSGWRLFVHESSYNDSAWTDSSGSYLFENIPLGRNRIWMTMQPSWEQIYPRFGQIYEYPVNYYDTHLTNLNFGVHPVPARIRIPITAIDSTGGFTRQIWFGARAGATIGISSADPEATLIDYSEGETQLPPKFEGMFDVRFEDPGGLRSRFGLGSYVDMRGLMPTQVDTYRVAFLPGSYFGGSYPMTFRWNSDSISASYQGPVMLSTSESIVDMKLMNNVVITNPAISYFNIIAARPQLTFMYWPGWNLVSLDAQPLTNITGLLFPVASTTAFFYDPSGDYIPSGTLAPGIGYWLRFNAAMESFAAVSEPLKSELLDLAEGWNLIGTIGVPVAVSNIQTIPPDVRSSNFYGFKTTYVIADTLQPKRAYWVKMAQAGQMTLAASASNAIHAINSLQQVGKGNELLNQLFFMDADGCSQTLEFSEANTRTQNMQRYEMPPLPPDGAFDVRFGANRMREQFNVPKAVPIHLTSAQFPLTIKWNIVSQKNQYSLLIDSCRYGLQGTGSMLLAYAPGHLQLSMADAAERTGNFILAQNYPNPFNPTTEFRFQTANLGSVSLKVFDILGKEVATIMNELLPAGEHRYVWNASGIASGMYFYKLQSKSATLVKKLVLLK